MHMTYEVEHIILLCSRCDVQCSVCHITDSWISLWMATSLNRDYIYICIYDALQSWDIFETPWKVKDSLSNWHLMVFFSNFRYAIYFHNQVSSQGALSQLAAVEMEVGREETERCSWLDDLEMQVMVASIHIIHIIHILFIIYIDTYISINNCALEISKMFNSITNWCSNDSSRLDLDAVETCRIFA